MYKMRPYAQIFRRVGDAWRWGMGIIASDGQEYRDEKGYIVREVLNLQVTVTHPMEGWPIEGSGWGMQALERYAEQLLSGENSFGFEYTYGERLRNYKIGKSLYVDQLNNVIKQLRKTSVTRRAVAITWMPGFDISKDDPPCMLVDDFKLRDGVLSLAAYFRSHDFGRGWPQNMYGLQKLLKYVADEVEVEVGEITTFSRSAHVYIV